MHAFTSVCIHGCVSLLHIAMLPLASSDCGNTVYNGSVGNVTSPNYPTYLYDHYLNCSNIILATQRSHFHLSFLYFVVTSCGMCLCDWLEVSNSFTFGEKNEFSLLIQKTTIYANHHCVSLIGFLLHLFHPQGITVSENLLIANLLRHVPRQFADNELPCKEFASYGVNVFKYCPYSAILR